MKPWENPIFADLKPKIVLDFWRFHTENPHIFTLYQKFADELLSRGRRNYGINAITERIRWHINVETQGDEFKINNNHAPCYARLLVIHDARFEGMFRMRSTPGTVKIGSIGHPS